MAETIRYETTRPCRIGGIPVTPGTLVGELTIIDPNCTPDWWVNAVRSGILIEETKKPQGDPVKPAGSDRCFKIQEFIRPTCIRYTLPPADPEDLAKLYQVGDAALTPGTVVAELTMIDPNCTPEWWSGAIRFGDMIAVTTEPQRDPVNADT